MEQFYVTHIKGQKVKEWIKYQKTTNVFIDKYLNTATSLNYYWHSFGSGSIGYFYLHATGKGRDGVVQTFSEKYLNCPIAGIWILKKQSTGKRSRIQLH